MSGREASIADVAGENDLLVPVRDVAASAGAPAALMLDRAGRIAMSATARLRCRLRPQGGQRHGDGGISRPARAKEK